MREVENVLWVIAAWLSFGAGAIVIWMQAPQFIAAPVFVASAMTICRALSIIRLPTTGKVEAEAGKEE